MGDAGSIVGTVSLALQLVQGLSKYYTRFRSYSDDVEAVITRTKRLEGVLRILERPIQHLERDGDPISEEIRGCIAECLTGIAKLKEYQQKCCETKPAPDAFAKKVLQMQNRFEYPFRKSSLEDLHRVLDRLLENLLLILQALHM
jgi:hypothetical protein